MLISGCAYLCDKTRDDIRETIKYYKHIWLTNYRILRIFKDWKCCVSYLFLLLPLSGNYVFLIGFLFHLLFENPNYMYVLCQHQFKFIWTSPSNLSSDPSVCLSQAGSNKLIINPCLNAWNVVIWIGTLGYAWLQLFKGFIKGGQMNRFMHRNFLKIIVFKFFWPKTHLSETRKISH